MTIARGLVAALLLGFAATGWTRAAEVAELKVLYVGSERGSDYVSFLKGKVWR